MTELRTSLDLLQHLIAFPSVSQLSNEAVSDFVGERLIALGFEVERTDYVDRGGVRKINLVARRDPLPGGQHPPVGGLAYFSHTDVVPADRWGGPGGDPFAAVIADERIYGRGACDMKGSITAMLSAVAMVPANEQVAPLWIVCTADEEVGFEGAKELVAHSGAYRELVAAQPVSIIGEPTLQSVVHAHKGINGLRITSHGRAAHSSSTAGVNANVAMVPMLKTLLELEQVTRQSAAHQDERFDPPLLSWNFGVSDHCTAVNITPARSVAWVCLRPMPGIDGEDLIEQAAAKASELGLDFERLPGGDPFWADPELPYLCEWCELAGGTPRTVCYSTDGGIFRELERRVVCGPGDIAQAHTHDEWLSLDQLAGGIDLYSRAIRRWCCRQSTK